MTLFICPTPLGNLEDITLRVLRALKDVDLIAAENTLHTQKLLNHFGIKKPMMSYFDSGKADIKEEKLIEKLKKGTNIALVSSAGTPLLSDPGYDLVRKCIQEDIPVVPLPGPSAVVTALTVSGIAPYQFFFGGFLPSKAKARKIALAAAASYPCTLIFYEAPHRLQESLSDCLEVLGNRQAALVRELTKIHEEVQRGTLTQILQRVREKPVKGEMTLVIAGKESTAPANPEQIKEDLRLLLEKGVPVSQASRDVAKKYDISKNQIYTLAHSLLH